MNNQNMMLYLEESVKHFTFHSDKNSDSIDRIQNVIVIII